MAAQRLLVVEDELLVALDIESILTEAGMVVVGPAASAAEALELIASTAFDAALLDANLHGEPINDVAAALVERRIPFAYVTGYGRESLPPGFEATIITKPFDANQLVSATRELLARPGGPEPAG